VPNTVGWGNKLVMVFAEDTLCRLDKKQIVTNSTIALFSFTLFTLNPDKLSSTYLPCTANPPALNKLCTRIAKTTPYLPCTVTSYRLKYLDQCPVLASGNAYYHNRRAVSIYDEPFSRQFTYNLIVM